MLDWLLSGGADAIVRIAILAYALVGGVFLAFSDFLMRSLHRVGAAAGVAAMQSINREVFRWLFMTLFIGLAPVSLGFILFGALWAAEPQAAAFIVAGALYALGCFAVTAAGNVPMNDALGRLDPGSDAAARYWGERYLPRWTALNSLRGAACVGAAATLLFWVA